MELESTYMSDLHYLSDFVCYSLPSSIWPGLWLPLQSCFLTHCLSHSLYLAIDTGLPSVFPAGLYFVFCHSHWLKCSFSSLLLFIISLFSWPSTLKHQYHQYYFYLLLFTITPLDSIHFIFLDTPKLPVYYLSLHMRARI